MLETATHLLRKLSGIAVLYCAVVIGVLAWPASFYVLMVFALLWLKRRRSGTLTTLGSARWADRHDLRRAGMLGAKSGLILGRLPSPRKPFLFRAAPQDGLVRLPQAIHTTIVAPTGAGKGVSLAIPYLLASHESAVVTDFKGELAMRTGEHRRSKFAHSVVLLDPYRLVTQKPDTFNPLDFIHKKDPLALDDANDLGNGIVVRNGNEHEPHWNDMAEVVIAAVTATVVAYGEKGTRSLQTVREIISHPERLNLAIKLMMESDKWGGALAPMGGQLLQLADKERASVLSSALRHLRFLGTPAVSESTSTSSFDPSVLRTGKMTCYLILPPDRAHAQSGLLRMWVSSLLRACVRGGLS